MSGIGRFRDFIQDFTHLIDEAQSDEPRIVEGGKNLLAHLIGHDDWLPAECAALRADGYGQYLLHCDPLERFSVLSVVLAPGQKTPVHDHTVWGMVGVMRGVEHCLEYVKPPNQRTLEEKTGHDVQLGEIDLVSPSIGDIHQVANRRDTPAVSIHVYGANIGAVRRNTYDPRTGDQRAFISGYSNSLIPNVWDRSAQSG